MCPLVFVLQAMMRQWSEPLSHGAEQETAEHNENKEFTRHMCFYSKPNFFVFFEHHISLSKVFTLLISS